ncbi:hypothetical protein [Sansalvadorimonas verongulae]|uniref:hypothetical protein n=1 Tax=Sansalvadorimonas verongulae TaxID=2172824 RepID=UPI0012BBEF46|nr:hypothetical protein [Sansalvadorimonas verongulae]MTI14101.1 hypothetical protein [Sansalvadorimonas verongulae]
MTTENNKLHETIADSDKLIKTGENSLKRMEKIRKELGLSAGASKEFLEHIPDSAEKTQKAQKELKQFMDSVDADEQAEDSKSKKKNKKRSRLAKAMNKKLRI